MATDKQIRISCHNIIDKNCIGCQNEFMDNTFCLECPVYEKLCELGSLLIHDESNTGVPVRKFFLTVEEYKVMKFDQQMINKNIAKKIGVSLALLGKNISKWKKEGKL